MKTIGLIIPTRIEANPVIHNLNFKRNGSFYEGLIAGSRILLTISGVGSQKARQAAASLCRSGANMLASVGFCGALVPELRVGDLVTERIRSVDTPARTPAERQALTLKANAVAVDMETQAIVEEGTRRGVPIRVLRVVSDTFDTDLTPLFGTTGGFSAPRIALKLLLPTTWGLAHLLYRNSRIAQSRLCQALPASINHWALE